MVSEQIKIIYLPTLKQAIAFKTTVEYILGDGFIISLY